ncbi:hypothetical protein I8H83_02400 [Candidatus Saccharibacteria bacterium]|nr:hypothetical protein [Candidatus Saccharibacteria bacterium]
MNKIIAWSIVCMCLLISAGVPQKASAHVLVTNTGNTMGAVLHITPDDDPIAGESSHIFFDVQDKKLVDGLYNATLIISTSDGREETVKTEKDGSYVSARYVFPARGVYVLKLAIQQQGAEEHFTVTQRVSRGTIDEVSNQGVQTRHRWAEILVVASLACLGVLSTLFFSRIRTIFHQSQ